MRDQHVQPAVTGAKGAILLKVPDLEILYAQGADQPRPMASLTKLMTLRLVLDHIDAGHGQWSDLAVVSREAALIGGSTIALREGDRISVGDLVKGLLLSSGNDAAITLAEYVSGSTEDFVTGMNLKASRMGLSHTSYRNPYGYSARGHYSSPLDLAKLSWTLLHHERVSALSKRASDHIQVLGKAARPIRNTNKLLHLTSAVDGLKTGYTPAAGYCMAATAQKGDIRLIAVILGAPSARARDREALSLLEWGFSLRG